MRIQQQAFRVYCAPDELERTIAFYQDARGVACERRVPIAGTSSLVAKVGGFLIFAGDEDSLAPVRHVTAVFYVDSLDEFLPWLESRGTERLVGPRTVTGGRNAWIRHRDGLVVEYFEATR